MPPSREGPVAGDGEPIQPDQEGDGRREMDIRIDSVDPVHYPGVLKEEALDGRFPKDVEPLLQSDDLQGVVTGHVDRRVTQPFGEHGPAHLVNTIDETPVHDLDEKREAEKKSAEEATLKDGSVGSIDDLAEPKGRDLSLAPSVLTVPS